MKLHLFSLQTLAPLCLALAFVAPPAYSQQQDSPVPTIKYALEVVNGDLAKGQGGRYLLYRGKEVRATVGHAIDILRELHPEANFVLAPGVDEIDLVNLKLQAAEINEMLEGLRIASGNRFIFSLAGAVDPSTGLPVSGVSNGVLYRLQLADPGMISRTVEAFNLTTYLEKYATEDERRVAIQTLENTILETLDAFNQGSSQAVERPEFRFHPNSNLMIVIGRYDAIEISQKIISALVPHPLGASFGGARSNSSENASQRTNGQGTKPAADGKP